MISNKELGFRVILDKLPSGCWSFGIGFARKYYEEIYLYINFLIWNIKIGYLFAD